MFNYSVHEDFKYLTFPTTQFAMQSRERSKYFNLTGGTELINFNRNENNTIIIYGESNRLGLDNYPKINLLASTQKSIEIKKNTTISIFNIPIESKDIITEVINMKKLNTRVKSIPGRINT